MKIYRPIRTDRLTQKYGEDNVCALKNSDGKIKMPSVTINKPSGGCPAGYGSLYQLLGTKGHSGTDFAANHREPIYFDIDAGVEWEVMSLFSATGGHGVLVRSKEPIPLDKAPNQPGALLNLSKRQYDALGGRVHLMRYYGHMNEATTLKNNSKVELGDFIGYAGTSGASTGTHVHRHLLVCGTNEVNPFFYLDGDSDYKGRIDEDEFFENVFVNDREEAPLTPAQRVLFKLIKFLTEWVLRLEREIADKTK